MFTIGEKYSRKDVQNSLNVPEEKRNGIWDTGYVKYSECFYIFCNVGSPGSTGHDYKNIWIGDELHWSAKSTARRNQPQTEDLLNGRFPVHVFWRESTRESFVYQGIGKVKETEYSTPIRVIWQFDYDMQSNEELFHDEPSLLELFPEGAAKKILVNAYERNPLARKRCLDHYGFACSICGFEFEKEFGDLGKGFIHIHHLIDIARIGKEYHVDPISDLRPVCPNCHAMLHRKKPAYGIEEFKLAVKKK